MYARICPDCGAYLDPSERCDCSIEKAAPGAANTESGIGKISIYHFNERKEKSQWGSSLKSLC